MGTGGDRARRFLPEFFRVAGVVDESREFLDELVHITAPGDTFVLFASENASYPDQLALRGQFLSLQMVFTGPLRDASLDESRLTLLTEDDVPDMLHIISMNRLGPFERCRIEVGDYFGIREDGKLVAMAGERLHVDVYREISSV